MSNQETCNEHCSQHKTETARYHQRAIAAEAKLSLYTSWQPSDPGTKEAMATAATVEVWSHPAMRKREDALKILAVALTAAMVRLEEAEKERDEAVGLIKSGLPLAEGMAKEHDELTSSLAASRKEVEELRDVVLAQKMRIAASTEDRERMQTKINATEQWLSDNNFKTLDEVEAKVAAIESENVEISAHLKSCCAEVAALTASLASVTKERDALADEQCGSECVKAHASLAELRKRVGIARLALEKAEHGLIVTHNLDASDDPERGFINAFVIDNGAEMKAVGEALALIGRSSGPGPAPADQPAQKQGEDRG